MRHPLLAALVVAFLVAGRFLTRLPWPEPTRMVDADAGRAALLYPLVGLIIGGLLWGLASLLEAIPTGVAAMLVLVLWVWLTGALHLDGLSDSADGWVGGLGSRERTLEIMRDPRAGAMGIVAIVLVLLAKWTALAALLPAGALACLVWVPPLARTLLVALLLTTPYARPRGMASAAVAHLPRGAAWFVVATSLAGIALLARPAGLAALAATLGILVLWRRALLRRLGGFTGDNAGALVELTETGALVAVALAMG